MTFVCLHKKRLENLCGNLKVCSEMQFCLCYNNYGIKVLCSFMFIPLGCCNTRAVLSFFGGKCAVKCSEMQFFV